MIDLAVLKHAAAAARPGEAAAVALTANYVRRLVDEISEGRAAQAELAAIKRGGQACKA